MFNGRLCLLWMLHPSTHSREIWMNFGLIKTWALKASFSAHHPSRFKELWVHIIKLGLKIRVQCSAWSKNNKWRNNVDERYVMLCVIVCVGSVFVSRSWRGLDPQLGRTPVQTAVHGSDGLAMSYTHEPCHTPWPRHYVNSTVQYTVMTHAWSHICLTYPFLQSDCIIDCIVDYFCTQPLKPLVLHTPL